MWADREFQQIETTKKSNVNARDQKKKKKNNNNNNNNNNKTAMELSSSCDVIINLTHEIVILVNTEQYKFSSLKNRKKYNRVTSFYKTMFN